MRGEWQTYWEAGYTVDGSSDVLVSKHCRSEEEAQREALAGRVDDLARVIELGLAIKVTTWTRKWRTKSVYEYDERSTVQVDEPKRRVEAVER